MNKLPIWASLVTRHSSLVRRNGYLITIPIALAITLLLIIVATSYYQTIHAYPNGGGAYIVAHENLGALASLLYSRENWKGRFHVVTDVPFYLNR